MVTSGGEKHGARGPDKEKRSLAQSYTNSAYDARNYLLSLSYRWK